MKKKLLLGSAVLSLSALLAVGALVGVSKGEAIKAEAATTTVSGHRIYIEDQTGLGWTDNGVDPVAHIWDIEFDSNSGIQSYADFTTYGASFGSDFSVGNDFVNAKMSWTSGSHRQYELQIPWYIQSFKACFFAKKDGNDRYWYRNGDADTYRFTGTAGNTTKLYICSTDGYGPWWDGIKFRAGVSKVDEAGYTYSETTYSVTTAANPSAGGTVTGAGTYKNYQKATVTATANSGYSFTSWSDSGAASHSFTVTSNANLTANFAAIPALPTPVISKDASNNVTWNAVANAQSYEVTVDGNTTSYSTSAAREVAAIAKPGTHTISVKAIGDHVNYNDSAVASTNYTVDNGWYLVGSFQPTPFSEDLVGAVRMAEYVDEQSKSYYQGTVTVAAGAFVEAAYSTSAEHLDWQNWGSLVISPAEAAEDYPVYRGENEHDKSLYIQNAGSYTIKAYIENYAAHYVVTPNNYSASYKLSVGGNDVVLTHHSGNEYKAVVNLTRGETLSYKKNDVTVASTPKIVENNNIDRESNKIIFSATSVTVYVDVVAKTIFAEGLPNLPVGYHVIKNGSTVISMTYNSSPSDPSYLEYFTELTTFAANDVITFLDIQSSSSMLPDKRPCEFKIGTINAGGLGDKFEVVSAGIKAKEAVNTAVYLKLKSGLDEVYFGTVTEALVKAEEFAEQFLTKINAICDTTHGTGTDVDDLAEEWGKQKSAFNNDLIEGAQTILKDATTSHSVTVIANMIAQYTYVIQKYGNSLGANPDFLQKGLSQSSYANNVLANTINPSNTIAIIVVISLVAVTSIGGYLFIRGRKHD